MDALVYTSVAHHSISQASVEGIARHSATHNATSSISGMLALRLNMFFQYLEGPEEALAALFDRICRDPRHTLIHVIRLGPIPAARFSHWGMRPIDCLDTPAANEHLLRIEEALLASRGQQALEERNRWAINVSLDQLALLESPLAMA